MRSVGVSDEDLSQALERTLLALRIRRAAYAQARES
jgi:hypothetical protein